MFEPVNDQHAIAEVIFAITFQRQFTQGTLDDFATLHRHFQRELPRLDRQNAFQFSMDGLPPTPMPSSVNFQSFKRDGSIDWRFMAENNQVIVNCATYTRWNDISKRALNLLQLGIPILLRGENGVSSVTLQYLDVFNWREGADPYDLTHLISKDSPYVSPSLLKNRHSKQWHIHEGWFRDVEFNFKGRMLERIHVDAVEENKQFLTRFDVMHRIDLTTPAKRPNHLFDEASRQLAQLFNSLHDLNKDVLGAYIAPTMLERIGLKEAQG